MLVQDCRSKGRQPDTYLTTRVTNVPRRKRPPHTVPSAQARSSGPIEQLDDVKFCGLPPNYFMYKPAALITKIIRATRPSLSVRLQQRSRALMSDSPISFIIERSSPLTEVVPKSIAQYTIREQDGAISSLRCGLGDSRRHGRCPCPVFQR